MEEVPPNARKEAADDVQRKIGRNLLCFQQVEYLLKFLLSNKQRAGGIGQSADIQGRRDAKIRTRSMGQLVGQFAEEFIAGEQFEPEVPADIGAGWVSINFNYVHNDECDHKLQAELEALVSERNDLIHHFLSMWNSTPMDEIHRHLDQQHDKLRPMLARLEADAQALQRGRRRLAEWASSDQFQQTLELSWLRGSRLVIALCDIAQQRGDAGGWVSLDLAGQLLRRREPEDVARMQERYGHKTLKRLLLATQLFDVADQPARKGSRAIYRVKPSWTLVLNKANRPGTTPTSSDGETLPSV